jgi:hypothetical protein
MSYYSVNKYRKNRKISKPKAQLIHSKERCLERMGIELNGKIFKKMVGLIQKNMSIGQKKKTNRITIHKIELDNVIYNVCYDRKRKQIATVLPKEISEFEWDNLKTNP